MAQSSWLKILPRPIYSRTRFGNIETTTDSSMGYYVFCVRRSSIAGESVEQLGFVLERKSKQRVSSIESQFMADVAAVSLHRSGVYVEFRGNCFGGFACG